MLKLSLTGKQLAELYALEAMGIPNDIQSVSPDIPKQYQNYLIDTEKGRNILLTYAEDLVKRINKKNQPMVFDSIKTAIVNSDFNDDKIQKLKPNDKKLKQLAINFISDQNVGNIEELIFIINKEIDNSKIRSYLLKIWNLVENNSLKNFIKAIINDSLFLYLFWEYLFEENKRDYESDYNLFLGNNKNNPFDIFYNNDDPPFVIQKIINELESKINEAKDSNDRNIFYDIMIIIDKLSSISHHGGPVFEYADTSPNDEPNLIDIMHRKFGDRFLPWLIKSKNFPEEHQEDLQKWLDEQTHQEAYEAYLEDSDKPQLREDYYKHPFHSKKSKWISDKSKTFKNWIPQDSEEQKNIESIYNYMLSLPESDDKKHEIINWLKNINKLSNELDEKGQYKLSDKLDSFIKKCSII